MKKTLASLLTILILLPSCAALGDRGKPLSSEEDRRLRARELSGVERQQFYCERKLTEEQQAILEDGPPIYVQTDYGPIMVGGSRINRASIKETHAQQAEALHRALNQ